MNDNNRPPPLPERPSFEAPRRGSWLAIGLAGFGAAAAAIVLTFLTLGFFVPFLMLGVAIFGVIGLQYLVWGWLFERIYRSQARRETTGGRSAEDGMPMP
jgi:ABC-type thiamin/hydroxymethylpyrimidine transport system permease subunit